MSSARMRTILGLAALASDVVNDCDFADANRGHGERDVAVLLAERQGDIGLSWEIPLASRPGKCEFRLPLTLDSRSPLVYNSFILIVLLRAFAISLLIALAETAHGA